LSPPTGAAQFQPPTQCTDFLVRFPANKLKPNYPKTGVLQYQTSQIFEVNIILLCQPIPVKLIIHKSLKYETPDMVIFT